jgi:hypothetical protein
MEEPRSPIITPETGERDYVIELDGLQDLAQA